MAARQRPSLAVMTSGGDAPGMNAAVRSVVRTALDRGIDVYAIYEGYQGLVDGEDRIRRVSWDTVGGGILRRGGTIIGTARSAEFRTREGRLKAAKNLLERGIDKMIVIGGDGSLTGANLFRQEWPDLLRELVETKQVTAKLADRHPHLLITGMVGSIDNDMFGTDMTIGADTALHRITAAVDALTSTAASHQRSFVVEVMGRACGYLALMGALATGANWVLIPESPPHEGWEDEMCNLLKEGKTIGRRQSIVLVAEGAQDRKGNPITSSYVKQVMEERLGFSTRVTILGHVQRGGSPSVFDRNMSTLLGYHAVEEILNASPDSEAQLIGMRQNRVTKSPLMSCVRETQAVADAISNHDYDRAINLRGGSFRASMEIFQTLTQARPRSMEDNRNGLRLAIMHSGAPAPGMNTAARAAVRLAIDRGHIVIGIQNGFQGLITGGEQIQQLEWMSVSNWTSSGGAELGTNRKVPNRSEYYTIARTLEEYKIDGLLIIGGWPSYEAAYNLSTERENFSAFNIPIICLPASIDNNLPGSELSVGADTALNNIVDAIDKIKQSAVASRRTFIVEVMGKYCGYLALMSGMATGAERVYLPEAGVSLQDLQNDVNELTAGFKQGKRLGLVIRNEEANPIYTIGFMAALFEEEGGDLFEVRQAILGHLQQGGDPSPFDRILAIRFAARAVDFLIEKATHKEAAGAFIGLTNSQICWHNIEDLYRIWDRKLHRPKEQWWLELRKIARVMSQPDLVDFS